MGYSIYAKFGSADEAERMHAFLERHMKLPNELFPRLGPHAYCRLAMNDGLSYTNKDHEHIVGFDFNTARLEREMIHGLVCWMAQRSSFRREINSKKYPIIIYDGTDEWPIISPEEKANRSSDELYEEFDDGYYVADKHSVPVNSPEYERHLISDYFDYEKMTPEIAIRCNREPEFRDNCEPWQEALGRMNEEWQQMRDEFDRLAELWEQAHASPV